MSLLSFRPLLLAAAFLSLASADLAAQKPTPEQAQALLQTRPDLVEQLRQRIGASGMTLDQIHARLRAEGYPENMLDSYYPGAKDSLAGTPSEGVFSAVQALGITDEAAADSLRFLAGYRLFGDTTGLGAGRARERGWVVDTVVSHRYDDPFERPLPDSLDERGRIRAIRSADSLRRARRDSVQIDSLRIFGMEVFERGSTQFEPNLAGPVDANYRLGPGDRLVLVLTGDVEASYTLDVTREGFVVVPQVGRVDVANLTMAQLEDVLYSRLGRVYSGLRRGPGATTHFSITPARLRTNQIYVVGDVAQPGSYRVSAAGTALSALYAAGGPTEVGSLRNVEVRRGGRTVSTLDVYDYLLRGDATNDVRLENGDVVFVPVHGPRVKISGEVVRPAVYEMKPGETLADLVRTAGGFRASANRQRVQIERIVPVEQREPGRDRIVVDASARDLAAGPSGSLALENGDVVTVFAITDRVRAQVVVRGNVWSPGLIGFTPGMKVSDAVRLAGGPKPDTYLGQILITRLRGDSSRVQLRSALVDTTGRVTNDFALSDGDDIRIFSTTEFRPIRYVAVSGAVRRPGRYAYREGMTMRDLVLLAGGMEESAFLQAAEIARLPESRSGGKLATTVRVPLDSSYLFERGPDGHYLGAPGLPAPSGPAPEVDLQPYDNVLILQQPEWGLQRTVTVVGEVMYPGVYSLKTKGDRLRDVIGRAGGLTREGYADGVVFYRKRDALGRIGVDLKQVLKDADDRDNLLLQNGDSIFIPPYSGTVDVTGEVNSPVAVAYVPGENIDFYIAAAGGLSPKAADKRAYVTQPNGKVESRRSRWMFPDYKPKPRAGSTVVVPAKDPNDKTDLAQIIAITGTLAQVMAGVIAAIAIIKR